MKRFSTPVKRREASIGSGSGSGGKQRGTKMHSIRPTRSNFVMFLTMGILSIYLCGYWFILRPGIVNQDMSNNNNINSNGVNNVPTNSDNNHNGNDKDSSGKNVLPNQPETMSEKVAALQEANKVEVMPTDVTIGFAVTVTGCGSDPITEGAAVLKHSIHMSSIHGNLGGRYDYKMYAIYHPEGKKCSEPLKELGYELLMRDTPVQVEDMGGEFLREKIRKNGCCGEKELVKLEAYTLVDHPIVVHLDLDTLILKPLDTLFDWMLVNPEDLKATYDTSDIPIMWPELEIPSKVNAFFTRDYNMVGPTRKYKPVQGGFLVLRPSMDVYNEFVQIIKKGDFRQGSGWGGVMGVFYGSMTFQGLIPYYYDYLHPGQSVELNRCIYNQMADNPKDKKTVNDIPQGRCRTNEEECEDCRNRSIDEVITAHFTLCQKPWLCLPQDRDIIQQRLCRKLHHHWHLVRSDLEQSWNRPSKGSGTYHEEHFYGHCQKFGKEGYVPIERPYGS